MKRKIKIPTRFIRIDKVGRTIALMNRKTGKLKGRTRVEGIGDTTRNRRVVRNVDIDGDGDIDFFGGTVLGRTKKIRIRGSNRAKAYIRQI